MPSRLLEQIRSACRIRGYSDATASAYASWNARFIRYHHLQHPGSLRVSEVEAFLGFIAREHASATVNQAHAALCFMYRVVLKSPPEGLDDIPWARGAKTLPVVLSRGEVYRLLSVLRPPYRLLNGTAAR